MTKPMTFKELVDFHAGQILQELIAGKLRMGVWAALEGALAWREERDKAEGKTEPTPTLIMPQKRINRDEIAAFFVEGRGRFPIDMLRYDDCWPVDTDSCLAIESSQGDREPVGAMWRIQLNTISPTGPNVKRWESFGWKVLAGVPLA
jgi:hypothetical protein